MTSIVESKVEVEAELRKYKLYVTELGKVISLLLNVSGRLARAENAVMSLADDASATEKVGNLSPRSKSRYPGGNAVQPVLI